MRSDTQLLVMEAADALLFSGVRPTQQNIRERIGQGSLTTINKALNQWWSELGARIQGQRTAAELPEPLERMMQDIWRLATTHAEHGVKEQWDRAREEVAAARARAKEAQQEQVSAVAESQAKLDRAFARIEDLQAALDKQSAAQRQLEQQLIAAEKAKLELERDLKSQQSVVNRLEKSLEKQAKPANKNNSLQDLFEASSNSGLSPEERQTLEAENRNLKAALEAQDRKYALQAEMLRQAEARLQGSGNK